MNKTAIAVIGMVAFLATSADALRAPRVSCEACSHKKQIRFLQTAAQARKAAAAETNAVQDSEDTHDHDNHDFAGMKEANAAICEQMTASDK